MRFEYESNLNVRRNVNGNVIYFGSEMWIGFRIVICVVCVMFDA